MLMSSHHLTSSSITSVAFSDSFSGLFRVRGILKASPPPHKQNMVHPMFLHLQAAVLHTDVLQLQCMSSSMSCGADKVPGGTVRDSITS